MSTHRYRWLAVLLLALYFLAAVWMAFALPAHATPNELLNFEYVQVMRQIRGLPNRGLVDSEVRYTEWHQPPVYFTAAALVGLAIPVPPSDTNPPPPIEVEPNPFYLSTARGNLSPVVHITPRTAPLLYTTRLAAAFLGLLGAASLFLAGKTLYAPWVGLLMASLMAFQPTYLHLSGSANNDMPLTAVVAIAMSYALLLLHRQRRDPAHPPGAAAYFVLGLLGAAAILTKANGVFVLSFLGIVWLAGLLIYRSARVSAIQAGALLLGLLPLWAGWLWLNTVRMRDTLGLEGSLPVGRVLALGPADFFHVLPYLPSIWRSYWLDWSAGDVGYGPDWLYAFWLVAVGFMLLGWLRPWFGRGRRTTGDRQQPGGAAEGQKTAARRLMSVITSPTTLVLLGFLGISYLYFAVKALTVKEAGYLVPEGRWWLPGLPALAWLAAAGYARWWPSRRAEETACLVAATVPPLIAFGLLAFHLPYLYPRAERLAAGAEAPAPILTYGDALALVDARAEDSVIGRPAAVELTWRALRDLDADYAVSTQLLVLGPDGWRKLAEHNSYPGGGLDPTRGWAAGETFRDRIVLEPEGSLNGPTRAAVLVAVRDGDTTLAAASGDTPVDPPLAAGVVLRPAEPLTPGAPLEQPVDFGGQFRLVGAETGAVDGAPGVTLWWEALRTPEADLTVFAHLVDDTGALVTTADAPPDGGRSPTTTWRAGDIIRDIHLFPAGQDIAPGWAIRVGAYRPDTGERLPATQAGTPLPDNAATVPLP
jgi:4-amino-4-deoxy-L-arabinose transferase-like glycosyltransferase